MEKVTLNMLGFREAKEQSLLAYDNNLISEESSNI